MRDDNCTMKPAPLSEYTPGPWMRTGYGFCRKGGGATIGGCSREADAALCAAAPDMLEALLTCVEPTEPGADCPLPADLYNKVCAAIAKATEASHA